MTQAGDEFLGRRAGGLLRLVGLAGLDGGLEARAALVVVQPQFERPWLEVRGKVEAMGAQARRERGELVGLPVVGAGGEGDRGGDRRGGGGGGDDGGNRFMPPVHRAALTRRGTKDEHPWKTRPRDAVIARDLRGVHRAAGRGRPGDRRAAADFLAVEGFGVVSAPDAGGAIDALGTHAIACVVLDVMLPGGSGFDVCRRIREHSDVPLLFLSARGEDEDKLRGLALGADDYIVKSATPAEVVARVKAVLRRSDAGATRAGASTGASRSTATRTR